MAPVGADWRVCGREGGFALLIVLWTLVLIAFILTHVTTAGRTEVRIADNLARNAAAQAAADGGIYQAIFNQADPRPDHRWPLDGSAHELQIGVSQITVHIEDEAGRINPNLASMTLLDGLNRAVGADPQMAADLALGIIEWIGGPSKRTPEEVLAQYRAAGLDYSPPRSPLESLDELGQVRGMTPDFLDALRPHLGLFGPAEPKAAAADPMVRAAMAIAGRIAPSTGQSAAATGSSAVPELLTVRISAIARGPGNAQASRTAIVRIGAVGDPGYALLTWDH